MRSSCATGPRWIVGLALLIAGFGASCGDDGTKQTQVRGLGGAKPTKAAGDAKAGDAKAGDATPGTPPPPPADKPLERPRPVLTRDDFSTVTRDPFESFIGTQIVELEPDRPRAQRDVRMAEYNFEDLTLVAIVHSGRNIVPRALFVAGDGTSKAIKQGEYFSRAEVLLASVNRDYVEVEVVDEALSSNLNLARGERRAIYLKHE